MKIKNYILLLLVVSGFRMSAQLTQSELRAIDSLKLIANGDFQDTTKLEALKEWDNLIYPFDTDLDLELNERILEISEKGLNRSNNTSREAELYLRNKGMACNNIGLIYNDFGNYKDALLNFQVSLQIAEYFKDSIKQGNATNNIGMIYLHLNMPEKALEYYDRSIAFDPDDDYSLATYYNNVGLCYIALKDTTKALDSYFLSLKYADLAEDFAGKGNTLSNIGLIYTYQEKLDTSIFYFNEAIANYEKMGDKAGIAHALQSIGLCYMFMGRYPLAKAYCQRGYNLAKESKSLTALKTSCDCLYSVNKLEGNESEALRYHEEFHLYKDSLESNSKNQEILRLDFQFNMDRQRLADSLQFANEEEVQRLKYDTDLAKKQKTQNALFVGLALLLLLGILAFVGYQSKKKDNQIIARQKQEVETQKHIVEEKNKEITDSINYAKRIQEAILPGETAFSNCLPGSFIIYKPKDIVAGDFYWLEQTDSKIIFAVADCTGHGVPGAMVSVVCHNALNRAVNEFKLTDPGKILDKTRELVVGTFENESAKNKTMGTIRDGMDISLCVLDKTKNELQFAGANNSLFLVRDGALFETAADKQPIGKYAEEKPFSTIKVEIKQGDILYLYTDGYADQFGGPDGKKFKYKQLKELLINNSKIALSEQAKVLNNAFENWKGNLEQIDDVCLMGVMI